MEDKELMIEIDLVERYNLDYIGEAWKECYLDFNAFTIDDIKKYLPKFAKADVNDEAVVQDSFDSLLELLKKNYVSGKVVSKGNVVDLPKESVGKLPSKIVLGAISFLFQKTNQNSAQV